MAINTATFLEKNNSYRGTSYLLSTPVPLEHFVGLSYDTNRMHYNCLPVIHVYGDYHFALHGLDEFWGNESWRQEFFNSDIFKGMVTAFEFAVDNITAERFSFSFIMNSMTVERWDQIPQCKYGKATLTNHLRATKRKYLDTAIYRQSQKPYIPLELGGFNYYRLAMGWRMPASSVWEEEAGSKIVFS